MRDARTKNLLPKVQVKVIGSDNPLFISGETDLRGVFVAEGVRGMVTAVARKGDLEYAFYRGTTYLGERESTGKAAATADRGREQRRSQMRPTRRSTAISKCRMRPITSSRSIAFSSATISRRR